MTTPITPQELKNRYPNLDQIAIDTYFNTVYPDAYQCFYCGSLDNSCDRQIILALLAHLIAIYSLTDKGNAYDNQKVNSKSVESVSVSFQQINPNNVTERFLFFSRTQYGQEFLNLTQVNSLKAFCI